MKLLFESWRKYLREDNKQAFKEIDSLLKEAYPKENWYTYDELGSGGSGAVYLIQNEDSIERKALKIVKPTGKHYKKEEKAYSWVVNNRESLPEEIKKHLPVVDNVKRLNSGTIMIRMEVLTSPPSSVLDDLFAPQDDYAKETQRKTDSLLRDSSSVGRIVDDALGNLAQVLGSSEQKVKKVILNKWTDFYKESENGPWGEDPKEKLKNIIFSVVKGFSSNPSVQNWIKTSINGSFDTTFQSYIIPMGAGGEGEGEKMSDEAAKLFPEAESMLNAIRVLSKEHGFSARDVHSRNVMMRPDSNELVIVDLGLFQIKGDT